MLRTKELDLEFYGLFDKKTQKQLVLNSGKFLWKKAHHAKLALRSQINYFTIVKNCYSIVTELEKYSNAGWIIQYKDGASIFYDSDGLLNKIESYKLFDYLLNHIFEIKRIELKTNED